MTTVLHLERATLERFNRVKDSLKTQGLVDNIDDCINYLITYYEKGVKQWFR